ncbi:MAG: thioredoxin family protein [Pseudomonadales bacterium]
MKIHVLLIMLLALSACGQKAPETNIENLAEQNTAEGIHWFEGSVDQAFAKAAADNKPVFLYWGAVWCPPCHELKATVFQEPSFIQASRQFVSVYLDGDTPGAQKYAEQYSVMGYPTLVVFNTSGEEFTRIPNGLDLGAYANVLQYALNDLQPIGTLVKRIGATPDDDKLALSAAECSMLAQHSWQQDANILTLASNNEVFARAADNCPQTSQDEKTILSVLHMQQIMANEKTLRGVDVRSATALIDRVLQNPARLQTNMYLFLDAGESLAPMLTESQHAKFAALYSGLSDSTEESTFTRVQALRALIALDKAKSVEFRSGTAERIADLRSQAETLDRADPKFHATINATGNMLVESGQLTEAKELLSAEVSRSKYVYYFMGELADIEQKLGNADAAIEWRRKAFDQARGPATRFQWGVNYLRTVLELDSNNMAAVRNGFNEVFAELAASRSMYQRSRTRLEGLDESLREWASEDASRMEALSEFRGTAQVHCQSLPASEQAKNYCESFLQGSEA